MLIDFYIDLTCLNTHYHVSVHTLKRPKITFKRNNPTLSPQLSISTKLTCISIPLSCFVPFEILTVSKEKKTGCSIPSTCVKCRRSCACSQVFLLTGQNL